MQISWNLTKTTHAVHNKTRASPVIVHFFAPAARRLFPGVFFIRAFRVFRS
jgi:hypothetical protein